MRAEDFDADIAELTEWRRDFQAYPEITFDVHRTVGLVEARLRANACAALNNILVCTSCPHALARSRDFNGTIILIFQP